MGGYDPRQFEELHRNVLLVAPNADVAKRRALSLVEGWSLPHKDNLFEVEKLLDLCAAANEYGHGIRLTRATAEKPFTFECNYMPIARKAAE